MPLGVNSLQNVSLPSGWDGAELERLSLRDGTTYAQIISDINGALGLLNGDLTGGYLAGVMSPTDMAEMEYRTGTGDGFVRATEYGRPDVSRGATTGHMLPLLDYDRGMGWTAKFLEQCRRAQIDADIAAVIDDARQQFEKSVYTRFFKLEVDTGAASGLGASGASPGWADAGSPSNTVAFTPPPRYDRATAFAATHSHYLRLNGITQANLETAVAHVWEHGHDAPYDLLISLADLGSWVNTTNVTGFKPRVDGLIQYGTNETLGLVSPEYIGVVNTRYGTVRMKASARIPTNYWGVFKSYGALDARNPLRVRFDPFRGFGVRLVVENMSRYPLYEAVAQLMYGVGIGDRTSAAVVENDSSGNYATPTIS